MAIFSFFVFYAYGGMRVPEYNDCRLLSGCLIYPNEHPSSMSESSNPIPEEPPEPLSFSIDLQPVEDLVPEHDPSPGIISFDLLNAEPEDVLPPIPEAVPTPSLISSRLTLEIPQSTLHAGDRDVLDTSHIEVFFFF